MVQPEVLASNRRREKLQRHTFANLMYLDNLVFEIGNLLPPFLRDFFHRLVFGAYGKRVLIDYRTYIRYPKKVFFGDDVTVNRDCKIYASFLVKNTSIRLEDGATLAPGVTLFGAGQDPSKPGLPDVAADIVIGKGAYVGGNSTIRYGVTIGEGAVVGAGAVVVADVPDWTIVAGIPARKIGTRTRKSL